MLNLAKHGLPFLFKVLSVQTALSIQAHPDKDLAARLHAARPDMYKDDNHKPEMTLAVSNFEALCQFQKANHVLENLRACPELVAVAGVYQLGDTVPSALRRDRPLVVTLRGDALCMEQDGKALPADPANCVYLGR